MITHFITNQDRLLSDVVNNILPASDKLSFLVGYFYFSGFEEIYQKIGKKQIRMLIGLEIEHDIANRIREIEVLGDSDIPRGGIRDNYLKSLVGLFNETDYFDSQEKQAAFRLFLDKLKDGSLEIRKTRQPNHAKLYIFENTPEFNQGGEFPGTIITGSSNLTRSGFRDRFEINIISRESATFKEAKVIFDQLWNDAVRIADKDNLDDFLHSVVEKAWLDKLPKPFLLYVRVLTEYFGNEVGQRVRMPAEITRGKYFNLKYQIDAIERALDIIQRHNGVIIADVVGLGKSIIASVVAYNLNRKVIVISPPHLKEQWEEYAFQFDFTAKVYSSGSIAKALEENDQKEEMLILVDEAHKYRNELTEDYANLHKLCQRNKVMLLTATPFNNLPQDIFSMVKLFQLPTRSTLQTVENLSFQFRELIREYKKIKDMQKKGADAALVAQGIRRVAQEIRNILFPLVIRRSRLDLDAIEDYKQDLKRQKISFPKVKDPELLEYPLNDLSDLYEETLVAISPDDDSKGFIGARYMPTSYIKNFEKYRQRIAREMGIDENLLKQSQVELAKFMRHLLVRRFESSIYAFKSTLETLIQQSRLICDWYEKKGLVPIYKRGKLPDVNALLDAVEGSFEGEIQDAVFAKELQQHIDKGLWFIEKKEIRVDFLKDVKRDIELLEDIHRRWFGRGMPNDPKLNHFRETIQRQLQKDPRRKIVVFTEFADTAQHLYDHLNADLRVFKYSSQDASRQNKETIRRNFDAGWSVQDNDYDILIATDAISEGFNLHRAGTIFNYDIPYNPTRVIQRVGRINRVNKKMFDELYICNFFPTDTGERETRIGQISTLKMAMVHALLGEDTKVLTKDEELQSFFARQMRDALGQQEELSPEARHEDFIRNLRAFHPEIVQSARAVPKRCRIRRSARRPHKGALIFGKKGQESAFKLGISTSQCIPLGVADALDLFEADMQEEAQKVSSDFEPVYNHAKANLFAGRTQVAMDRGKQDAINKIEAMKAHLPAERDYLEDLLYVSKSLDALPGRFAKILRAIDGNKLPEDLHNFKQEVPHSYLLDIIQREQTIEEGRETLILAEELI